MISSSSFFNVLQGFSALATVYILWLTQKSHVKSLLIAGQSIEANILLKQMDVYNACSVRYDQITAERLRLSKQENIDDDDGKGFYLRFWELQHNQFIFFQRGYIDTSIMESWMNWRKDEYNENAPLSSKNTEIGYQWGWAKARERFKNTDFTNFIDRIHNTDPKRVVQEAAREAARDRKNLEVKIRQFRL